MQRRSTLVPRREAIAGIASLATAPLIGCESGGVARSADHGKRKDAPAAEPLVIVPAVHTTDGNGATLARVFPSPYLQNLDPFVLLDDFNVGPPAGFPTHPHRGFEAFTYMVQGAFHHIDNLGNDSAISAGGTQRFTSGRGAYHSEMPATDGENRGLQLWVNLPRRLKQMNPNYAGNDARTIPETRNASEKRRTVVGGNSPVELQTQVSYMDITLNAGARFQHTIEDGWNTIVYVISGALELAGNRIAEQQAALPKPGELSLLAVGPTRFAFLSGKPHHEPILHHGPFVD
ncbi:MAG TPA: pirin family protein [Polyangiaceae bacterium]|nr:pirin family protein [Polyangiaceae bacterium]